MKIFTFFMLTRGTQESKIDVLKLLPLVLLKFRSSFLWVLRFLRSTSVVLPSLICSALTSHFPNSEWTESSPKWKNQKNNSKVLSEYWMAISRFQRMYLLLTMEIQTTFPTFKRLSKFTLVSTSWKVAWSQ